MDRAGPTKGGPVTHGVNAQSCRFTRDRPSSFHRGAHAARESEAEGIIPTVGNRDPPPAPGLSWTTPRTHRTAPDKVRRGARRTEDPDQVA